MSINQHMYLVSCDYAPINKQVILTLMYEMRAL